MNAPKLTRRSSPAHVLRGGIPFASASSWLPPPGVAHACGFAAPAAGPNHSLPFERNRLRPPGARPSGAAAPFPLWALGLAAVALFRVPSPQKKDKRR